MWVRTNLGCILDFETEIGEAADVLFAIDELNAAMTLRIGLEEEEESGGDEDQDTTTEDDEYNTGYICRLLYLKKPGVKFINF